MQTITISGSFCNALFEESIRDYHIYDDIYQTLRNPYKDGTIQALLYQKNWIDTVQWHLEDTIRKPDLRSEDIIALKRWIDRSNQERTDLVEKIDDWFISEQKAVHKQPDARLNSETPAWLIDRMSILALKIYHMREQTLRDDVDHEHISKCAIKLNILLEQQRDLASCLNELLEDVSLGKRYIKVYRQMKMYNDATLNPALYAKKDK